MGALVAAVDVGTGSARCGIFDRTGRLLGRGSHPLSCRRPSEGQGEYSSDAIWGAVGFCVRAALDAAGARPDVIGGIAFDATCSLVVRSRTGAPLPVSPDGDPAFDTIAWFDHRALAEAEACTATGHPAIAEQGGAASPEMQIPKLLWLKRRLPGTWAEMGAAFDLADFLSWKATGALLRSSVTMDTKWSYRAGGAAGWPLDLLDAVGLSDLPERAGVPGPPVPPGACIGLLTPGAAAHLGLAPGTPVAAGAVDAFAGALALLSGSDAPERRLALIAGTSSCLMGLSRTGAPVPGLWGPYRDAVLPGFLAFEGGQTASGALFDHLCRLWTGRPPDEALHAQIWTRIEALRAAEGPDLAPDLHVLPDFRGNRSPFADPRALGVISGLGLDPSFDGLCRLTWRAAVGLALGLRQIVETFEAAGIVCETIHMGGGHVRSPLLTQLTADALGRPVCVADGNDAMLLGTAVLAATAAGLFSSLTAAAAASAPPRVTHHPDPSSQQRMEAAQRVYRTMQRHRAELVRARTGDTAACASGQAS